MIDREQLCALAIAAIEDADARIVLADALEERGEQWATYARQLPWEGRSYEYLYLRRWYAIAAVLLFGQWPTSWPLAERCRRADWSQVDVDAWEQYGMLRHEPALAVAQFPRDAVGDD